MLYRIVSIISFIARYLLCFFTIEAVDIFADAGAQVLWSFVFGGVLYSVFNLICFPIVGAVSQKWRIESSAFKSFLYFVLYLPLIGLTYGILLLLTHFGVLPISLPIL